MTCIICEKSEEKKIFEDLTQCKNCGLIYYNNNFNGSELNALYQEDYFTGKEYLNYKNDKLIIQKNFSCRLKKIIKYIKGGTLFEIGCAYGFFLEIARKYFFVEGIDITEKPTEFAKKELGLNVNTGNYLDLRLKSKKDIFCMWDTIEHLQSPEKFIKKVSLELNSGGYLFLTTGDIESILAKIRGRKWRMIHPPTHLYYFSKDTITKLLKKYKLEVVSITHPGIYRNLKQILYSLFFLNKRNVPKIFQKILNNLDFPIYINTYDIIMIVAKKI